MTDHTDEELIALAKKCGAEVAPIAGTQCDSKTITFTDLSILAFAGLLRQQDLARMARMREALEYAQDIAKNVHGYSMTIVDKALSETADIQGQRSQWHSMRDKMPEEDGYYLVLNSNCLVKNETVPIVMHWIGATKGWYSHQLTIMYSGVTHWMPLPAAPSARSTKGE